MILNLILKYVNIYVQSKNMIKNIKLYYLSPIIMFPINKIVFRETYT